MSDSEYRVWVSSARERYLAAKKLLEAASNDPPNEPYRSKYAAGEIFSQIETELENKWRSNPILQIKLISSLLSYERGIIAVETEEKTTGCNLLTSSLEELTDVSEKPECCFLALSILNQLGVLWSDRGETEKALNYLLKAETLYIEYKTKNEACPFVFEDIFLMKNSGKSTWAEFEKRFTYTSYFLAQVYGHMNEITNAAKYCRETLRRQKESEEYETLDWVSNCFMLSQLYTQKKLYQASKHLLSCAAHVLMKYELKVEKENQDAWAEVQQCKASLSCCWIKYAIAVLKDSPLDEDKDIEHFCRLLEEKDVLTIENKIPYPINTYDNAKNVFLFAQKQVSVAQSFYTLNEYASNYAEITQDHSKLYKELAAIDPDPSRQCKMHKRRSNLLEELLNKLNPKFYLSICRQLQFELGEICHEMMGLKNMYGNPNGNGLSGKMAAKINVLATKGIGHFMNFIDTLKDKNGKLPEVFSDDVVRPALIAHFYIAQYFTKIIESSVDRKLHNFTESEQYYKYIVSYVEQNPQHASCVEKELPLIKTMMELMPEKMSKITSSILY